MAATKEAYFKDLQPESNMDYIKYRIASDDNIIRQLARMAQNCDFCNAGGCKEFQGQTTNEGWNHTTYVTGCRDWEVTKNADGSLTTAFVYDNHYRGHESVYGTSE